MWGSVPCMNDHARTTASSNFWKVMNSVISWMRSIVCGCGILYCPLEMLRSCFLRSSSLQMCSGRALSTSHHATSTWCGNFSSKVHSGSVQCSASPVRAVCGILSSRSLPAGCLHPVARPPRPVRKCSLALVRPALELLEIVDRFQHMRQTAPFKAPRAVPTTWQ